jgi:hypothetical protein
MYKTDDYLRVNVFELSEVLKEAIRDRFSAIGHGEQNGLWGRGK